MRPDVIEVMKNRPVVPHLEPRWWWRIKAGNGRILAHSEMYASKASCLRSARAFHKRHPEMVLQVVK